MAVPWIQRLYIPSPGQPDAAVRAAALNCTISTESAVARGQAPWSFTLPAVVLYITQNRMEVIAEPTTLAAVDALETTLAAGTPPVIYTVAQHVGQVNPHGITPAAIEAAPAIHTHPEYEGGGGGPHSHVDADLPAGIARDAEVAAAYSPIAHNHDSAYSASGHSHAAVPDARLLTFTKASDQAVTGTSIVDVAGLAFPVEANSTYLFSMYVDITASGGSSPTHAYQFTGPASPDRFFVKRAQMTSATAVAVSVATALAANMTAGATVANIRQTFEGMIKTGAAAGTVQLRVTPAGTNPTSTIARGSGGYATKVA